MVASIGADSIAGWGVYGTVATPTTTTSTASITAGATTVTVTSPTGFAVGQQIIVDTTGYPEARLISDVTGSVITVADAFGYAHASGVTVVTGTTTTLSAPSLVNDTTVTVTSATGIVIGSIIQVDVNSVSGVKTSEVRKVTGVATNTLTLDAALNYAHASAAQVTLVTNPYTHTLNEQNTLPSLTVEKNIGGFQSLQFAGCRANKFDLKADSPTAVTVANEMPFVFAEANLNVFGTLRTEVSNTTVSIENGMKETYTYSNFHGPSFITPVTLHTSGSIDVVFDSLDDATYGDFEKMANGTLGAYQFKLVHPDGSSVITINQPQVVLNKFANDLKVEDVVMSTMTYEASRPLSGATQYTIQATVANAVYLPY